MANMNGARAQSIELDPTVLGGLIHQLRNQLNAIVGAAGLLAATATSSDQRELAAVVLSGSEELAGLIDEVLDWELIQGHELELALHPFAVRSSVEAAVGRLRAAATARGLTIDLRIDDTLPAAIVGDSRRLEQVLHALVRLAVERSEQGTIQVTFTAEPGDGPLRVRVSINAPALVLPGGLLVAATSAAPSPDLDAGESFDAVVLQTTRSVVEIMDGELAVTARAGEPGAEIDFTFLALPAAAPAASERPLAGMQVLVVAADSTERRMLALQTEHWGAPSTAVEPDEAAHAVEARVFDVAVVEHSPPAVDGLAIASAIRARRDRHDLPIVLIVAGPVGAEEVTAADSGVVQATLGKPVTPDKLHDVLSQVGRMHAPPGAAESQPEAPTPGVTLRVLVADDNSLNQNMLRRQITRLGHQVDIVSNGRDAVEAIGHQAYDALLMDVLMPEMDGLAAAAEIVRRWTPGTRPRLIALTAMAAPGDEERCRKAGFDDYMSKPVHLDELAEALRAAAGWRTVPKTLG